MADTKEATNNASATSNATKKVVKKASPKKASPKKVSSKKASSKATAKPATKKITKKAAKKPIAKKSSKKLAKKTAKKVSKKTSKKASLKADNRLEQLQGLLQENLSGINTDGAEALAKNIWLAGLGAYSKTFDELAERVDDMQGRYTTINSEGQKIFEELVIRGNTIQSDLEKTVKKGRDSLEDRVEDFKKRFGGGLSSIVDVRARLRDAAEKIEGLSVKLKKK